MRFFRIYYCEQGGHTHTRWFAGANPDAHFGKCGDLVFTNEEFGQLQLVMLSKRVEFIDETPQEVRP